MDTCTGLTTTGSRCRRLPGPGQTQCHLHKENGKQCSVCLLALTRNTRTLPCGHEFHLKCVDRWKRSCRHTPSCPMCRAPFDVPNYRVRIVIDRVAEATTEVRSYVTSNLQAIQEEFGLDLRMLDQQDQATLNILFDLENHENLEDFLRELNAPGLNLLQ